MTRTWLYCLLISLAGYGALVYATLFFAGLPGVLSWPTVGYLVGFTGLSVLVKRFGFHVAPEVTHNLVGLVDVAAIIILGPVPGAWVASLSGLAYLVLHAARHRQTSATELLAIPLFNSGLKALMALVGGALYLAAGGRLAFATLSADLVLPLALLMVTRFALDHLGWSGLILVSEGVPALRRFLRTIFTTSLLFELAPLPFALLLVGAYAQGPLALTLMALAVILVGYVLQRLSEVTAHLRSRVAELTTFDELGRAIVQAQLDVDGLCELAYEQASRLLDTSHFMLGLLDEEGEYLIARVWVEEGARRPPARLPLGDGMAWMAEHKRPLLVRDSRREELPFTPQATDTVTLSALFVPLMAGPKLIGSISVRSPRPQAFTEEQLRTLSVIAHQLAVAIENARLYQLATERVRELSNLNEIGRAITSSLDLEEILTQIMERAVQLLGSEAGSLLLHDERTGELVFHIVTGGKGEAVRGLRLRPDQGLAGAAFTSGQPLIVNQVHTDPRFYRLDEQTGFTTRNLLAVPLIGQAGPIGVIEVMNRRDGRPYDRRDQDQLMLLASQAAIAIDNARLYQAQRLRAEQLNLLNQVGRRIAAILDLDELLDQVVRLVRDTFNYYNVSIGLIEGDQVVFEHGVIDPARLIPEVMPPFPLRFPIQGPGLLAWAAREGRTAYAPDVNADARYLFVQYLPAARSELVVPLKIGDRVVGVLDVESDQPNAFDTHAQTLLESLADQVAIAVENARLVQEQQEEAWVTTALFQAGEALASLTYLEDILETLVRLVPILVGVDRCLIFLWDGEEEVHVAAAAWGLPDPTRRAFYELRLRPGQLLLLDEVRLTRRAAQVWDVAGDGRIPAHWATAWQLDAVLAQPLISKNQVLGVLLVDLNPRAQRSPARSGAIISGLANQAAIAIESAQLYEALQEEAWISTAMLQVAEAVGRLTDLDEILSTVARITPLLVGVERCGILLWEAESQVFYPAQVYGLPRSRLDDFMALRFNPAQIPVLEAVRHEPRPIVMEVAQLDPVLLTAFGAGTLLGLPLVARGEVVGLMVLDYAAEPTRFTSRRMDVAQGIANQAAIAVESAQLYREMAAKERLERELQVARQIQASFLPERCPALPGWQVAANWRSARQVGGDFYDFIELPGDRWGLVIADVSDKGVPAALFMALSRTLIRAAAVDGRGPAAVLRHANALMLADTRAEMFVSVFYAVLDSRRRVLTYANAGHNPPFLVRGESGALLRLHDHGIVLGIVEDVQLADHQVALTPGDVLVLYTDGVTDAVNGQDEEFGEGRLADVVQQNAARPAEEIAAAINAAVAEFVGDTPAVDDYTLVVLKYGAQGEEAAVTCAVEPVR